MAGSQSVLLLLLSSALVSASPQYGPGGDFGGGSSGGPPSNSGGSGPGGQGNNGFGFGSGFQNVNHVLVAHALLAVLAWALFMPVGAIVLRLNIQSPHLLKIHAFCQVSAYLAYIVAAGMGVYMIRQSAPHQDLWHNAHPLIGLAILAVGLFQPVWGLIHHGIFKRKMTDWQTGRSQSKPGRTAWGRVHLWVGRILISKIPPNLYWLGRSIFPFFCGRARKTQVSRNKEKCFKIPPPLLCQSHANPAIPRHTNRVL